MDFNAMNNMPNPYLSSIAGIAVLSLILAIMLHPEPFTQNR